jgi:aspartyl-tRNA(Asn)/glutamyl-tRNA(Gln) amidotransferase subunit C
MPITLEEVKHLATLAKLSFNAEDLKKIAKELDAIVDYVEQLKELNVDNVPATSHVLDLNNVLRDDKIEPWLTTEEALQNAPAQKMGYFSVPKVIG